MLPLLTCFRSKSPFKSPLGLAIQNMLILLQLSFEAKIGADIGPGLPDECNSVLEPHAFLLHEVGDDEGG